MKRPLVLLLSLSLLAAACGPYDGYGPQPVIVPGPTAVGQGAPPGLPGSAANPYCAYQGRWTAGRLRAPAGGYPAVIFDGAQARAQVDEAEGSLRLHAEVAQGGFRFLGFLDLAEEHPLRAAAPVALREGVVLSAGTEARIHEARPGELLLGLAREEEEIRLLLPAQRWLPCEAVALRYEYREEATARREREALALPAEPPRAFLPAGRSARLSVEPGAEPFLELSGGEHGRSLYLLETRGDHSRVLLHRWDGTLFYGWTPREALEEVPEGGLGGSIFGGLGAGREVEICVSASPLPIYAARQGEGGQPPAQPPEPIGSLEANTPFERLAQREDGLFALGPPPRASVRPGEGVAWLSRSPTPLRCRRARHDPADAYRQALASQATARIRVESTVTAIEGLGGVGVGGRCEGELLVLPREHLGCRLELRCGGNLVYGNRPTNGYFACELTEGPPGEPPIVRGEDTNTSEADGASGDPALRIDTGAGTLTLRDDASGSMGALRVEARIDVAAALPSET